MCTVQCKSDPDPPISCNHCLALFARCLVLASVSKTAVITHAKVLLASGTSENFLISADSLNFLKASYNTALKKYCQAYDLHIKFWYMRDHR